MSKIVDGRITLSRLRSNIDGPCWELSIQCATSLARIATVTIDNETFSEMVGGLAAQPVKVEVPDDLTVVGKQRQTTSVVITDERLNSSSVKSFEEIVDDHRATCEVDGWVMRCPLRGSLSAGQYNPFAGTLRVPMVRYVEVEE